MSSARPNTGTRTSDGALGAVENALVSVSQVGFDYEGEPILEDVSLTVERGEFVALVGPSGCGKSTILNLVSGVLEPRSGSVKANGLSNRSDRLGKISYMQQKDLLLPWRSVAENSRLGLELRGIGSRESGEAGAKLADSFGIADVLDSMPWQLSGGMRQRVALLRAVLPDNDVLLLDEPFGALDAITRRSLQQWLLNVLDTEDKAVVLVTHDVEEAILLADRILVMSANPGQIIDEVAVDIGEQSPGLDVTTSSDFIELKKRILNSLGDQEMAG